MLASRRVVIATTAAHAQAQIHAHAHMTAKATNSVAAAADAQKMQSDDELQNWEEYYDDVVDHDLEVPE